MTKDTTTGPDTFICAADSGEHWWAICDSHGSQWGYLTEGEAQEAADAPKTFCPGCQVEMVELVEDSDGWWLFDATVDEDDIEPLDCFFQPFPTEQEAREWAEDVGHQVVALPGVTEEVAA